MDLHTVHTYIDIHGHTCCTYIHRHTYMDILMSELYITTVPTCWQGVAHDAVTTSQQCQHADKAWHMMQLLHHNSANMLTRRGTWCSYYITTVPTCWQGVAHDAVTTSQQCQHADKAWHMMHLLHHNSANMLTRHGTRCSYYITTVPTCWQGVAHDAVTTSQQC